MKKFVVKTVFFICVTMIPLIGIPVATLKILSTASFAVAEDKTVVFVGPSWGEDAVNDKIFTYAINVCKSGTGSSFQSYIKIKKILEVNPQIKTVCYTIDGEAWNLPNMYPLFSEYTLDRFLPFLSSSDWLFVIKNTDIVGALARMLHWNLTNAVKQITDHNITYYDLNLGRYSYTETEKLKEDINRATVINTEENDKVIVDSYLEQTYFHKIIDLCSEKGVELVFFHTPFYHSSEYSQST